MPDISAELSNYEKEYNAFVKTSLQLVPEDRLRGGVCGFWSPKQVVDHFTGWGNEVLSNFEKIKAGRTPVMEYDDDTFNAQAVAERSQLSWEASLSDMEKIKQKIVTFAWQLTDQDLARSDVYCNWLQAVAEDYQLHCAQLQQWVKE
jgi:hypothetical protein